MSAGSTRGLKVASLGMVPGPRTKTCPARSNRAVSQPKPVTSTRWPRTREGLVRRRVHWCDTRRVEPSGASSSMNAESAPRERGDLAQAHLDGLVEEQRRAADQSGGDRRHERLDSRPGECAGEASDSGFRWPEPISRHPEFHVKRSLLFRSPRGGRGAAGTIRHDRAGVVIQCATIGQVLIGDAGIMYGSCLGFTAHRS